jgi:spermidine synthase
MLNFILAAALVFFIEERAGLLPKNLAFLLIPTATMCLGAFSFRAVEQAYLKTFYYGVRIPDVEWQTVRNIWDTLKEIPAVERYHSPYQRIELIRSSMRSFWAMDPTDGVTLYLDRKLQFAETSYRIYHESMVYGAFNLAKRVPAKVLILGGGDGLLANEFLKHPGVEKVDLVELDPKMIELAKTHVDFLRLNGNALADSRVRVHVTDGFSYMKKQKPGSIDAVFIDFPYPHSPDLLRLYSVEFYRIVKMALAKDGFAIMDGPIYSDVEASDYDLTERPQWVIHETLRAAGFPSIFTFGPYEGFYYFTPQHTQLGFDYSSVPEQITNGALVNMKSTNHLMETVPQDGGRVNSLFRPRAIMPPESR